MTVSRCPLRVGVLLLLTGLISCAGTPAPAAIEDPFQVALETLQAEFNFPGATAAYVSANGDVVTAFTGLADREAEAGMDGETRMLAASIGKTMVAATVLALAQEGIVSLDTPVSRWLGDREWYTRLANHDTVTLRHLLTHTGGIADHVYSERFAAALARRWREPGNPFTPEELVAFILDEPALHVAGQGWAYSDTGYILVGLVLEQASGQGYFDLIRQRFLLPLALTDTAPADRRALPRLAAGYTAPDNPFGLPEKSLREDGSLAWHPGLEWTGGGLISSARDLARWGHVLFTGKALAEEYLGPLLHSVPVDPSRPAASYGLGVAIYDRDSANHVYGHAGWIPGYTSSLRHYTADGLTIALQINTDVGIYGQAVTQMETRLHEAARQHQSKRTGEKGAR